MHRKEIAWKSQYFSKNFFNFPIQKILKPTYKYKALCFLPSLFLMQKLLQKAHEDIAQLIFKKEKDFVLSKIDEPRVSDVHRSSRGEKRWDSILPP